MRYKKEILGNFIDVESGYAFKSKDFTSSGIPVIKIKNIKPPFVSLDDVDYVPQDFESEYERFRINYNDILIAMTGSHINQWESVVGRVARVKFDKSTLLNQRVGRIVLKENCNADIGYIYYFLSQDKIKIELSSKAGGAANQANINSSHIKQLELPIPCVEVQSKIASILSAYDDLIENNQKQIKLLEEAAQRLYKEWFVDLRFPGHEDVKIVDGVPEGWKKTPLGDIAWFKRGTTITKSKVVEGNVPVIAGGIEAAYYHNTANTVAPVVTVSGSGANAGYVNIHSIDVFASDCSFIDKNSTDYITFVYCFLKTNDNHMKNLQKGSAQPHVYAKDLNAIEFIRPKDELINSFCFIVDDMFSKIGKLNKSIKILQEARDRLLPKLMSGEIEV